MNIKNTQGFLRELSIITEHYDCPNVKDKIIDLLSDHGITAIDESNCEGRKGLHCQDCIHKTPVFNHFICGKYYK
jgi:hypothetical protein